MRPAQPVLARRQGCACAALLCIEHAPLAQALQHRALLQASRLGRVAGCDHQEMLSSSTPDGINIATFISTLRWKKLKKTAQPFSVMVEGDSLDESCFRLCQKLDLMVRAEAGGATT